MIRQAISCDICGTEKRQTNHWFVAYEQGGELRVSGWTSRHRLRADSKHLCGQTCLHKLMDEFMAKSIASRTKPALADAGCDIEASATPLVEPTPPLSVAAIKSSARLVTPPLQIPSRPTIRPQPEIRTIPARPQCEDFAPLSSDLPRYVSRASQAEAWERERERELRATENRPDISARRSNA